MSEGHLRLVSLSVLGGPLHGKRHNPDEVVAEILIGSDPDCHLVVELPGISPIHAKIWADLNESTVYDTSAPLGVYLNTERVAEKAKIGQGDVLWLGPPQQPDSVCVQLHFEPWVEVLPAASVYDASEAVVIEDEAASTLAVTAEKDAGEAVEAEPIPVEPVEVVEAVEADAVVAEEPVVAPAPAEPRAAAGVEDDPFFVGEAIAPATPAPAPAPAPPSAPPPASPAPAAAPADDWAISTEEPPAEAHAEPMPVSADEFFVAGDAEPSGPSEPTAAPAPAFGEAQAPAFVDAETVVEPEAPSFDLPPLEPPASVPAPAPPRPSSPAAPPPAPAAPAPTKPAPAPAARRAGAPAPTPAPAKAEAPAPATPEPKPAPRPTPAEPKPTRAEPTHEPKAEPAAAKPKAAPAPRAAEPQAARPAAAPRPQPAAARRPAGAPAARAAARRPAATRSRGGGAPRWLRPAGLALAGLLVVGAIGFVVSRVFFAAVRLDAVEPTRVRVGQRATIIGSGFGNEPGAQTVVFGEREAKVLQASPKRLDVEVPEAVTEAGAESRVSVVVRARGRTSGVVDVTVFQGPRLHGISPGAAMPGEEVMLAGAGWGIGATVRFGSLPATILEVQPTHIRAVVPELPQGAGSEAPVVVSVGGVDSNQAPFIVGHLPVLTGTNPASAAPGDIVSLAGRGFDSDPARNDVRVGGVPALVIASSPESLQVVVPRVGAGEPTRTVEVRVPGSDNVGQTPLQLQPLPATVGFRFVAEPFSPSPGRSHALVASDLGPAFVFAASGGRTAAERAAVAADRLNAAAQPLRTTVGLTLEARGVEGDPVIGLSGSAETLIDVTEEDAGAYNEDWTGLRGRGGPVTRARLARWWEAVGRDLVLLTIRGQAPRHAAALAPEGRVLDQLYQAAQQAGGGGVPRRVIDEARPQLRDGLRLIGLRVPPSVTAESQTPTAAAPIAAAATPGPPPLQFEGTWGGSQVEQGQRQYLSVTVRGSGGSVAYEGGITLTVPMLTLEKPRRDQVRFSVQIRGGVRHYAGRWDGEAISGNVSTDAAGKNVVATFELRRR